MEGDLEQPCYSKVNDVIIKQHTEFKINDVVTHKTRGFNFDFNDLAQWVNSLTRVLRMEIIVINLKTSILRKLSKNQTE